MVEEKTAHIVGGEVVLLGAPHKRFTPRQMRFIEEYLVDLSATQAAIRAGYKARNANQIGSELLHKPGIREAIAELKAERSRRTQITADQVLTELAKLAFANLMDYMRPGKDGDLCIDFSRLSRDQAAALVAVSVEDFTDSRPKDARMVRRIRLKLADKLGALVALGRHLGMFVDKLELKRNPIDEMSPAALRALDAYLAASLEGSLEDAGTADAPG